MPKGLNLHHLLSERLMRMTLMHSEITCKLISTGIKGAKYLDRGSVSSDHADLEMPSKPNNGNFIFKEE